MEGYLNTEKFGFSFGVKVFENLKKNFFTHYQKVFDVITKRLDGESLVFCDLPVEAGVSKGERHSDCDFLCIDRCLHLRCAIKSAVPHSLPFGGVLCSTFCRHGQKVE